MTINEARPAPVDPSLLQLLDRARQRGVRSANELSVTQAREQIVALVDPGAPAAPVPCVEDVEMEADGRCVRGRLYRPCATPAGCVVFLHGGGWVVGDLEMADDLCRGLALSTDCEILSVDYGLAPEHPFPEGLDDCSAAIEWFAVQRPAVDLVIMGESSGANLAAAACRRARDRGGPRIGLQILAYPITDASMETPSYAERGNGPGMLTRAAMEWYFAHYVPASIDRDHADLSPLRAADLSGLPPALVVVAEHDPLRDDGLAYADALAAAGVDVEVDFHPDMTHGFLGYWQHLPAAERSINRISDLIRRQTGAASRARVVPADGRDA